MKRGASHVHETHGAVRALSLDCIVLALACLANVFYYSAFINGCAGIILDKPNTTSS
jgi:hypothetical protein